MPQCTQLVLDAGPLLSLSPLRGLAETFVTVSQVLAELKDKRAKEHLERLGSHYGVKIEIMSPDPASMVAGKSGMKLVAYTFNFIQLLQRQRKPEITLSCRSQIYVFWH